MSDKISRPIATGIGRDGDATVRAIAWPDGTFVLETDSLDAAWAEAEAALPEGWVVDTLQRYHDGSWTASASHWVGGPPGMAHMDTGHGEGPTPAAALRALTEKLHISASSKRPFEPDFTLPSGLVRFTAEKPGEGAE